MADRIIAVFAEGLGLSPNDINEDTSPENTPQWDSLAAMGLVALLEETFDIELTTEEIMSMRSVKLAREALKVHGVSDI
jgi:acyl carrier protein